MEWPRACAKFKFKSSILRRSLSAIHVHAHPCTQATSVRSITGALELKDTEIKRRDEVCTVVLRIVLNVRVYAWACMHVRARDQANTMCRRMLACLYAYTQMCAHTHTLTRAHACARTHMCTNTQELRRSQIAMQAKEQELRAKEVCQRN